MKLIISLLMKVLLVISIVAVFSCPFFELVSAQDNTQYVKQQISSRTKILEKFSKLESDANNIFINRIYDGELVNYLGAMNTLSLFYSKTDTSVQNSIQSLLSTTCLGLGYSNSNKDSYIGRGLDGIISGKVMDIDSIKTIFQNLLDAQIDLYLNKILIPSALYNSVLQLDSLYIGSRDPFKSTLIDYQVISLYTLYANAHLLFLNDMVVNGAQLYGLTLDQVNTLHAKINPLITDYRNSLYEIEARAKTALENWANYYYSDMPQEEWRLKNRYNNFAQQYVFDISNYWDSFDSIKFPKGLIYENANIYRELIGAPYNGDDKKSNEEIDSFINQNAPVYQGKLKGIYYKNYYCEQSTRNINMVKYFGARQYFFREDIEKDGLIYGDENPEYQKQYIDLNSINVSSLYTYNSWDIFAGPVDPIRDFQWGSTILNSNIGVTIEDYYIEKEFVSYPDKVLALAIPISYNTCTVGCKNRGDNKPKLVEGALIGFVGSDVLDENIVLESVGTMIDAQKYYKAYLSEYKKDTTYYKYNMKLGTDSLVSGMLTFKIKYNPSNNLAATFKLFIDLVPTNMGSQSITVYTSKNERECMSQVGTRTFTPSSAIGQIIELVNIQLKPINDNYVTIASGFDYYVANLVFVPVQ